MQPSTQRLLIIIQYKPLASVLVIKPLYRLALGKQLINPKDLIAPQVV